MNFNTMLAIQDKRWFMGLPSPAAAALVATFVWLMVDNHITGMESRWFAWVIMLFAGISMITNMEIYSGKDFNIKRSVPFVVIVLVALGFSLVSLDPPIVLFLLFLAYGGSGYLLWIKRRVFRNPTISSVSD